MADRSQVIQKAVHANQLLEDPLIKQIIEDMHIEVFRNWKKTAGKDTESRENYYMLGVAIRRFEEALQTAIANGKHEEFLLKREEEPTNG